MGCATVTDIIPCWYAIHTHLRQEYRAEMNLHAMKVETFFPKIQDCRFNEFSGEPSYFVKPLFPGYLFARFALSDLFHKVRFTRGVHSVVCVGSNPAPIDGRVIEIITAQIGATGFVQLGSDLEPGAKVLIQAGPFKGLTGIFQRRASAVDRIKILLDCVSFQAQVEVDKNYIKTL
jgi:transcriptional antiterminator RfaH